MNDREKYLKTRKQLLLEQHRRLTAEAEVEKLKAENLRLQALLSYMFSSSLNPPKKGVNEQLN